MHNVFGWKTSSLIYELLKLYIYILTNTILLVLPVCSLHIHMKVIAHANNWSLTLTFHIIFTRAPVNFMWAQAWVCSSVATPLTS